MPSPGPRESENRRGGNYNNRERKRDTRRDYNRGDSRGGGGGSGRDYNSNSSRGGGGGASGARREDHRGDNRHAARSRSPARGERRHNERPRSPRQNNPREYDRSRRGSDDRRPAAAAPRAGFGGSIHTREGGGGASVSSSRAPPGPTGPRGREIKPSTNSRDLDVMDEDGEWDVDDDDDEARMKKVMGFAGFRSTKNTKVPGNDKLYGVRKDKQTQYRQYMNRVGGFNRPLSPSRM